MIATKALPKAFTQHSELELTILLNESLLIFTVYEVLNARTSTPFIQLRNCPRNILKLIISRKVPRTFS